MVIGRVWADRTDRRTGCIVKESFSLPHVVTRVTSVLPSVAGKDDLNHNRATARDLVWISPRVTQNLSVGSDRCGARGPDGCLGLTSRLNTKRNMPHAYV